MTNQQHYPFTLKPLPYAYDALEPYIEKETVTIHHDRHQQTYVNNLNQQLENHPEYHQWTLEEIVTKIESIKPEIRTAVRNNAGGVYNHELYWDSMTPNAPVAPSGELLSAIDAVYGSFDNFKAELTKAAIGVFGSGWAYLVVTPEGKLMIVSTPNQNTPLPEGHCPILIVDVWEHAYYLGYQNKRPDYVANWWNTVNWDEVAKKYQACRG